jgi:hypothetical protein
LFQHEHIQVADRINQFQIFDASASPSTQLTVRAAYTGGTPVRDGRARLSTGCGLQIVQAELDHFLPRAGMNGEDDRLFDLGKICSFSLTVLYPRTSVPLQLTRQLQHRLIRGG